MISHSINLAERLQKQDLEKSLVMSSAYCSVYCNSEGVPLVGFLKMYLGGVYIYHVFACMPGGVAADNSGLCCCVPCLLSAIVSLCLVM